MSTFPLTPGSPFWNARQEMLNMGRRTPFDRYLNPVPRQAPDPQMLQQLQEEQERQRKLAVARQAMEARGKESLGQVRQAQEVGGQASGNALQDAISQIQRGRDRHAATLEQSAPPLRAGPPPQYRDPKFSFADRIGSGVRALASGRNILGIANSLLNYRNNKRAAANRAHASRMRGWVDGRERAADVNKKESDALRSRLDVIAPGWDNPHGAQDAVHKDAETTDVYSQTASRDSGRVLGEMAAPGERAYREALTNQANALADASRRQGQNAGTKAEQDERLLRAKIREIEQNIATGKSRETLYGAQGRAVSADSQPTRYFGAIFDENVSQKQALQQQIDRLRAQERRGVAGVQPQLDNLIDQRDALQRDLTGGRAVLEAKAFRMMLKGDDILGEDGKIDWEKVRRGDVSDSLSQGQVRRSVLETLDRIQ